MKTIAKNTDSKPSPFGELDPLGGGEILTKPVDTMSVPERAQAHAVLNFIKGRIEARMKELRTPILEDANAHGEKVIGTDGKPTGSVRLKVPGAKILDKFTKKKEPDYKKTTDLLVKRGLAIVTLYDQVETYVYNPSKEQKAVATGVLTQAEIDALKPETHALEVEADDELKTMLETAAKALPSAVSE